MNRTRAYLWVVLLLLSSLADATSPPLDCHSIRDGAELTQLAPNVVIVHVGSQRTGSRPRISHISILASEQRIRVRDIENKLRFSGECDELLFLTNELDRLKICQFHDTFSLPSQMLMTANIVKQLDSCDHDCVRNFELGFIEDRYGIGSEWQLLGPEELSELNAARRLEQEATYSGVGYNAESAQAPECTQTKYLPHATGVVTN